MVDTVAIHHEAYRLLGAGLSVIPVRADGRKRPAVSWKPYQARLPTTEELAQWFRLRPMGLAVIGGEVSGNLEILDFDVHALIDPWAQMVHDLCPGLLARLPQVQTPSHGRHVYYRCLVIAGNQKLAQRPSENGRPETTIETRGGGGYAIVPPSPPGCHPLHKPYVLMQGDLAAIPTIMPDERITLLNAARSFDGYVKPERIVSDRFPSPPSQLHGDRPGDVFNARADWPAILEPHGWIMVGQHGDMTFWKRPNKREPGISATTNYAGSFLLYVFSSNAWPFEPDTAYSKFAAYSLLEHGGDFAAAAKALSRRGYGDRGDASKTSKSASSGIIRTRAGLRVREVPSAGRTIVRTVPAKEGPAWRC
jgi:Bifunctional DNA primase/polymerase, N-terminal